MALSVPNVKGIIVMRVSFKRFQGAIPFFLFFWSVQAYAQYGPPAPEYIEEPKTKNEMEEVLSFSYGKDTLQDEIYEDSPVMRAFASYETILQNGDEDLHMLMLTGKSAAMFKDKPYSAAAMEAEYERLEGCGNKALIQSDGRALVTFPDQQDTCFPYLIKFDYDRWLIDLYTMQTIFNVEKGVSWTVKPSVKNHPYEFGIRVIRKESGRDVLIYKD